MPPQDAFQPGAFQRGAFQMGSLGPASAINPWRIPRWLLRFERAGKTIYLSDVGGEIPNADQTTTFYVPAVIDASPAGLQIDLERMSIPLPSATVHISPSALQEFFLSIDDLGRADVVLSSWDGKKA